MSTGKLPITGRRLAGFAGALTIGTIGGTICNHFQLPLAWLLGAMIACTAASILRVPINGIEHARPPVMAVIGVLLGAGFSPQIFNHVLNWIPSLAGLAVFVVVSGFLGSFYFRYFARFDTTTAFFAAMPGGLIEMVTLGHERGGDQRLIALVHSARILLVVASLPYLVQFVSEVTIVQSNAGRASITDTPIVSDLWLVGTAIVGSFVGKVARLPARYLLGPMLVSGFVHTADISSFQPPNEVVVIAQLVLGTLVGSRFSGISPMLVLRVIALTVGSTAILLILTLAAAFTLSFVTGLNIIALMLAYSPGGLTEMSLVALSLEIEVAFVATHHIARVLIVVAIASGLFRHARKIL